MSDLNRCTTCKGQKKVMGLGCMVRDCDECKGIGWIKAPAEILDVPEVECTSETSINKPSIKTTKKPKSKTGK